MDHVTEGTRVLNGGEEDCSLHDLFLPTSTFFLSVKLLHSSRRVVQEVEASYPLQGAKVSGHCV